jgi:hypothetical protein
MNKLADIIDANTEELAKAEVKAMGQVSRRLSSRRSFSLKMR